jgi:hypothetical protein
MRTQIAHGAADQPEATLASSCRNCPTTSGGMPASRKGASIDVANARIAPDMFTLAQQACRHHALNGIARLAYADLTPPLAEAYRGDFDFGNFRLL